MFGSDKLQRREKKNVLKTDFLIFGFAMKNTNKSQI